MEPIGNQINGQKEQTEVGIARLVFPFRGKGEAKISFPENLSEGEIEKLIMFLKAYTSQVTKENE